MRISDWSSDVCSSDLRFCRLAGAEPYLAANLRSLPARDFYEWIEYCNSPAGTTSLADLRAAGGDRETLNVDRKSDVSGKSVSVRVALGGCRIIKKKKTKY